MVPMAANGTILLCHFRGFDSYLYVVACLVADINNIRQTFVDLGIEWC